MEIDDSPPFTIGSDLYFEQQVDNNSIITDNKLFTNQHDLDVNSLFNNQLSIPKQQQQQQQQQQQPLQYTANANHHDINFSPTDNTSRVSSFANINNANSGVFINGRDLYFDDIDNNSRHRISGRLRNGSIDSYYAANVINHQLHLQQQQHQSQDYLQQQQQQQLQNKAIHNELSPLTTTTSRASSIQSGQPSFFSAQQYFTRNSIDQVPPSSLHRPSVDMFNHRQSMDSQGSQAQSQQSQQSSQQQQQQQQRNARYISFTSSISNILPFMGDKNQQRSPPSPPTPQNLINTNNQSRHLIRSIFKTNPTANQNIPANGTAVLNETPPNESEIPIPNELANASFLNGDPDLLLMTSPTKEEPEDELLQPKKAKKSKRSLFTRFKNPAPPAANATVAAAKSDTQELKMDEIITDVSGNVSLHHSSGTPSIVTNGANLLENSISESSTHQEPDYAALFENVGKRPKKSYRKPKSKAKDEDAAVVTSTTGESRNNSSSTVEKSSGSFFSKAKLKQEPGSEKSSLIDNTSVGNASLVSSSSNKDRDDDDDDDHDGKGNSTIPQSSIASASKRILGAKLISKKKSSARMKDYTAEELEAMCTVSSLNTPVASVISKGVEVEVDLASLDLPPDTKIFPTSIINSKNRTRGRKENREADLSDTSKIYLCNLCQRRFKRQEHLKRHFRSLHTFEKPYDCSICHKKFSRSDNLNQHLKIHKQEEEEKEALAASGEATQTKDEEVIME
ncbi:MNL1 Transcriptional regulator MNL1 [Candida maltosa Xu316]